MITEVTQWKNIGKEIQNGLGLLQSRGLSLESRQLVTAADNGQTWTIEISRKEAEFMYLLKLFLARLLPSVRFDKMAEGP